MMSWRMTPLKMGEPTPPTEQQPSSGLQWDHIETRPRRKMRPVFHSNSNGASWCKILAQKSAFDEAEGVVGTRVTKERWSVSIWDLAEFALKFSYTCTGMFFLNQKKPQWSHRGKEVWS